jgi:hypothetical protein
MQQRKKFQMVRVEDVTLSLETVCRTYHYHLLNLKHCSRALKVQEWVLMLFCELSLWCGFVHQLILNVCCGTSHVLWINVSALTHCVCLI